MFCKSCGYECKEDELYCQSCGAPLNETNQVVVEPVENKIPTNYKKTQVVGLIAFLFAIAGFFLFFC